MANVMEESLFCLCVSQVHSTGELSAAEMVVLTAYLSPGLLPQGLILHPSHLVFSKYSVRLNFSCAQEGFTAK